MRTKNNPEGETGDPRPARKENLLQAFDELWSDLFSTPVHLDSALSKRPTHLKSILAQIIPPILARPASTAESLGVGISPEEPWCLPPHRLASWATARQMAERLYLRLSEGLPEVAPIREDFPPRMIEEWEREWGAQVTDELVRALGTPAPLALRAVRRLGPDALLRELKAGDTLPVKAGLSRIAPMGVSLSGYTPVMHHPRFEEGLFEIQDEGSQLMSLVALWPSTYGACLRPFPGQASASEDRPAPLTDQPPAWTVVDACAGAGGKTLAIADALGGKGRVYAYDTSAKKLQALRRRASRAHLTNVQSVLVEPGKESKVASKFARRAQAVLVDAPCSGWGVLRRNPDIKWRQSSDTLDRMPEIQKRILAEYCELVAPGGRLTFGVCTFRKAETTEVAEAFSKAQPEFRLEEGGYLGPGPSDGFFMQTWVRGG